MDDEGLRCASYTHARRHPMVLGRIAGWTPPFQLSVTQLAVLVVSFLALVRLWWLWSPLLPHPVAVLAASPAGVPAGLAWAVRRLRVEGRSLARTGLGWLSLWSTPSTGRVAGGPNRDGRAWFPGASRVYIAAADER